MKRQRGWIQFPTGMIEALLCFAAIGLIAVIMLLAYGIWWMFTHVTITF